MVRLKHAILPRILVSPKHRSNGIYFYLVWVFSLLAVAIAFSQLLAQGLVSGADTGGRRYEGVTLTVEGRSRVSAIIQQD